jgi:hypothetical protein
MMEGVNSTMIHSFVNVIMNPQYNNNKEKKSLEVNDFRCFLLCEQAVNPVSFRLQVLPLSAGPASKALLGSVDLLRHPIQRW